jgi:hypothetical protein
MYRDTSAFFICSRFIMQLVYSFERKLRGKIASNLGRTLPSRGSITTPKTAEVLDTCMLIVYWPLTVSTYS